MRDILKIIIRYFTFNLDLIPEEKREHKLMCIFSLCF